MSADFFNTLNATFSGFIHVDSHQLYPGRACKANGFIASITAQAIDFTILTIVLVTLLAVGRLAHLPSLSVPRTKLLICSSTWSVPFITSLAALTLDVMRPVDMNWCEITPARPGLQYALARGWRLIIMLLAVCLHILIWCYVYRHHPLFSASTGAKAPRVVNTMYAASTPPEAHASIEAASCPSRRATGGDCSEFSLPLQGYDVSGAEFHAREKAIETRTERISRWIYIRHPGLINSISAFSPQSQSRLLIPQTSFDSSSTRPRSATRDPRCPGWSLPMSPPPCLPLTPRPHYHSQCPKVQKSFGTSTDQRQDVAMSFPGIGVNSQSYAPRYHEYVRSNNSAGARVQTSAEIAHRKFGSARQPAQVKWPFLDASSSRVQSSSRASTSTASAKKSDSGLVYHSLYPKVTKHSMNYVDRNALSSHSLSAIHSEGCQESSRLYNSKVLRSQHSFTLTSHRHGATPGRSGPIQQSTMSAKRTFEGSDGRLWKDSVSTPNGCSQLPKAEHSLELSVDSPRGTRPGPNYHSQCPKVTKTVSICPSRPDLSRPPSLAHQPEMFCTRTTISTAPGEPSPSPTLGLPPPPWAPQFKKQHRKTFLLSRSTWSDLTLSRHPPPTGDAVKNAGEIRRMLLLNAYILVYFIIWLPWIVNCFMEAQGHTPEDPRAMHALLGLPQYFGLVTAVIFAITEIHGTKKQKARAAKMGRADCVKSSLNFEGV